MCQEILASLRIHKPAFRPGKNLSYWTVLWVTLLGLEVYKGTMIISCLRGWKIWGGWGVGVFLNFCITAKCIFIIDIIHEYYIRLKNVIKYSSFVPLLMVLGQILVPKELLTAMNQLHDPDMTLS